MTAPAQKATIAIALTCALYANAASSAELSSYVRDQHNLGQGGDPVHLESMATAPLLFLRSKAAWRSLRYHVGSQIDHALTDTDFRNLLKSPRVRLQPCTGSIITAGIAEDGTHEWFSRECHDGEKLVAVRVLDAWRVVASQGCWNPVLEPHADRLEVMPSPIWQMPSPAWTVPTHPVEIIVPGHTEPPMAVPEPGILPLFLGGVIGWLIWRRRR